MKKRAILYIGMGLLVALYFYDRAHRVETTLPAIVETLTSSEATEGGARWHIAARIGDHLVDLDPVQVRPNTAVGDKICVTRTSRPNQTDSFRRANAGTEC